MSAKLWESSTINAFNTTLNGSISGADASIILTTTTGLVAPGVLVIDRVDNNNVSTPNTREYISFTGISTNTLTGCSRGLGGSAAQAHSSGAKVEEVLSVSHWGDLVDYLQASHDANGNILVTSTATIANLRITNSFNASNASIIGLYPSAASGQLWTSQGAGNGAWSAGGGIGGFNGQLFVPTSLPTTATDIMGTLGVGTTLTGQYINAWLRTPCSGASLSLTIKKYPSTTFGILTMAAGATFASSASIASPSLSAGDTLIGDINTSFNASDLTVLIRAT